MTKNSKSDFYRFIHRYRLIHRACHESVGKDISAVTLTEDVMVMLTEESNRTTGSGLPPHVYEAAYRTLLPIADRYLRNHFSPEEVERLKKDPEAIHIHLDVPEADADRKSGTRRRPGDGIMSNSQDKAGTPAPKSLSEMDCDEIIEILKSYTDELDELRRDLQPSEIKRKAIENGWTDDEIEEHCDVLEWFRHDISKWQMWFCNDVWKVIEKLGGHPCDYYLKNGLFLEDVIPWLWPRRSTVTRGSGSDNSESG